jgi:uncharacterized membrane protein
MAIVPALLCSSVALSNVHSWSLQRRTWGSQKVVDKLSVTALNTLASLDTTSDDVCADQKQPSDDPRLSDRAIKVQTSLEVPFSASVAFDAFSDFPRQAEFSPWLRKVEYLNPSGVAGKYLSKTKWTMVYMGIPFSWNAVITRVEHPNTLEWESTSGMQNYGSVEFSALNDNHTNVTMTMTFVAPRLVAALFQRSSALANTVQNRIIRTTLINFRDAVQKEESKPY